MRQPAELATLALILGVYGGWVAAGWLLYPALPGAAVIAMILLTALHASLVHEACHGHPTRHGWLNEALVTANPGLVWPYRRFRRLHLQHHADDRLTDPFDDPESFYRAAWWYAGRPAVLRAVLGWSNTLAGRLILGPPLAAVGLVAGDAARILHGDRPVTRAWALHLIGLLPVLGAVTWLFAMPVWAYALLVAWPAAAVIMLRSFAEHRWHETPQGRSIIVESSPLALLFLNNNLHLVHHTHPAEPWYRLPALYRARAADWAVRNDGYVYSGYWPLLRGYVLRAKEPVPHPAWRRHRPGRDSGLPHPPAPRGPSR